MPSTSFDVKCLSCSAEIGQIWNGRFFHDPACVTQPPRRGGTLRCCRCAGRLYLEPNLDNLLPPVDWTSRARRVADDVA
jgi:hypothetical protein